MKKILTALSVISICSSAVASGIDFKFHSPSFSGNGKSSHYLTIENIEKTRSDAIRSKQEAAAKALTEEAKNTPIAKFKANLEARFYTALAKQITDNVFGADGAQQDSGTYTAANGEVITWSTPAQTGNVVVVVTETDGTTTTYTMPKEDNS